ncbi:unnamed protein product [Musa textilis]
MAIRFLMAATASPPFELSKPSLCAASDGLRSVSGSATEVGANDVRMCQVGSLQHQVPLLGAAATRPHSSVCSPTGIFSRRWS